MNQISPKDRWLPRSWQGKQRAPRHVDMWSTSEDAIIRSLYPDYEAMRARMPRRSYHALRNRARALDVVEKKHVWTNPEVMRLKRMAEAGASTREMVAAFPFTNPNGIRGQISLRGFRRPSAGPKAFGVPLVDAVRQRAYEMGFKLTELDRLAGTGRYFSTYERHLGVRIEKITAALEQLGGELVVKWCDEE